MRKEPPSNTGLLNAYLPQAVIASPKPGKPGEFRKKPHLGVPPGFAQRLKSRAQIAKSPFGDSRRQSAKADFADVSARIYPRARRGNFVWSPGLRLLRCARNDTLGILGLRRTRRSGSLQLFTFPWLQFVVGSSEPEKIPRLGGREKASQDPLILGQTRRSAPEFP